MAEEKKDDPKLLEAIDFFEKMLETMPGDRTGLEFLSVAYEQIGERDKQIRTLIALSETLLKEGDAESASAIAAKLRNFTDVPAATRAAMVVERILSKKDSMSSMSAGDLQLSGELFIVEQERPKKARPPRPQEAAAGSVQAWISEAARSEVEIVWKWKEEGLIPQEVSAELLHVFVDLPATDYPVLISAPGLLEEQHPQYSNAAFESMQRLCTLPPVPLELFEVASDALDALPIDYIKVKGILPFAFMSDELLVGVMNGTKKKLLDEISELAGCTCHFFLVHPRAWHTVTKPLFESAVTD